MDKRDPADDFIKEGKLFATDELKNRIAKMDISELDYQDHPRQHYIDIYDKLILIQENRELLKYYLNIDPYIFQKNFKKQRKIELPLLNDSKKPKLEKRPEENNDFKLPPQHLLDQLVPKKKEDYTKPNNTYSRKDHSYPFRVPPNMIDLEPDESSSQIEDNSRLKRNEFPINGNNLVRKEILPLKDQSNFTNNITPDVDSNPFIINHRTPVQNDLSNFKPVENNILSQKIKGFSLGDSRKIIDAISKREEKREVNGETRNSVLSLKNFVDESVKATLEKLDSKRNIDTVTNHEIKKDPNTLAQEPILPVMESRVSNSSINKFNINSNSAFVRTSSSNINANTEEEYKIPNTISNNNFDLKNQSVKQPLQRNSFESIDSYLF